MVLNPLQGTIDEKPEDRKVEKLYFNRGKKIKISTDYDEGESGSMFDCALSQLKKTA